MVELKDAQETLYLLFNRAINNYDGLKNLNSFKDIFNKINIYENDLNIKYKIIKEMIKQNKYHEEIITFLNEKVKTFHNKIYNYYSKIYTKLNSLQTIIRYNMSSIFSDLSSCESQTEMVLYYEYSNIKKETNQININYSNYIKEYDKKIEYKSKSDHMTNEAIAYIYNINEYAEFKLNFTYKGGIWEKPKLLVTLVDKSKPNKIDLDFFTSCGKCCIEGQTYNLTLNDVNFTTIVEYDINTSSIIINTSTNIEEYSITESVYRNQQKSFKSIYAEFNGTVVNRSECSKDGNLTIYEKNIVKINVKHFNDLHIFTI